jgi:predicted GNAT superfamily acetyltransferase
MDALDARVVATATDPVLDDAIAALRRAEMLANVEVAELTAMPDVAAAAGLWDRIWQSGSTPRLGPEMLRALTHAGNYLGGATRDGRLVGALTGFFASGGSLHLHSHILGVDPRIRSAGIGFALKLHQRRWALERGLSRITWTFDPLVSANAYFNVNKLGAEGVEYHANFYGVMADAINGGGDTDRVLVSWRLDDPGVARLCLGETRSGDGAQQGPYALRVNADGAPHFDWRAAEDDGAEVVRCALPRDIVALRRSDPELASAWRTAVRDVLSAAFARGLLLRGATRDGVYLLSRAARG